ncbi:hypothetical protein ACP4OV_010568 [Aristida adscensionis]
MYPKKIWNILQLYEYVEVDLADKSELLLASNPLHNKVPVLLHGGRPVCESMLILEYLDDAFPGSGRAFLPTDPLGRAAARFWAAYVDDERVVGDPRGGDEEGEGGGGDAGTRGSGRAGGRARGRGERRRPGVVRRRRRGFVPAILASEPTTGLRIVDSGRTPLLVAWVERFCALDAARAVIRLVEMGKKRLADAELDASAAAVSK